MADELDRGAAAVYCDDLRTEDNGKRLFVGVYGPHIIVPKFPFVLPNFVVSLKVWTSSKHPFGFIHWTVLFDEDTIGEERIDVQQQLTELRSSPKYVEGEEHAGPDGRLLIEQQIIFRPFVLTKPGVIRVRVITDAGDIKVNSASVIDTEVAEAKGIQRTAQA